MPSVAAEPSPLTLPPTSGLPAPEIGGVVPVTVPVVELVVPVRAPLFVERLLRVPVVLLDDPGLVDMPGVVVMPGVDIEPVEPVEPGLIEPMPVEPAPVEPGDDVPPPAPVPDAPPEPVPTWATAAPANVNATSAPKE